MNITRSLFTVIGLALCISLASHAANLPAPAPVVRERLLMDSGWKFHLGNDWGIGQSLSKAGTGYGPANVSYSDASWREVNLPHDWAIELPFDQKADVSHGYKALGEAFPENSVSWYRRTFNLAKADAARRIWIEFDGVYRDCTVFVNGWFVGRHESGYSSFRYDVTDVANFGGKNVVSVRVDATQNEGWFYEGAGIYRHVWLVKTAPVAIAPDGIFVQSSFRNNVPGGPAQVLVQTELQNTQSAVADGAIMWEIIGPDGKVAARGREPVRIEGARAVVARYEVRIDEPELWSPETPKLYKLVSALVIANQTLERTETQFGLRTVAFDTQKGFLLNGQPYVIKGTCNHQDHAGVGAALPDRLQYFRISKLKEMGCNAYRTSHNPPTPELLEACDRLGMLVMDENRLLGSDEANIDRLEKLIKRDRNHASVVIWSIANEEFGTAGTPAGKRVAATMQAAIRRLDTTRPITYAAPVGNEFPGVNEVIEVRGWNYHIGQGVDDYHAAHPKQPNVGTEQGSTVSTRGIYENDTSRGYVSAYDVNAPDWANTAHDWWSFYATRPWLSGGFVWTGFDYRGEPTPYEWPCISSHFGILDTCGFPKDNFWLYQSWWTEKPMVHVMPHWNWSGREGQEIDVRAYSNCDEVELFLNGQSLGKQAMPRNSQLSWKVKYTPGTLSAKAYKAGQVAAEDKVETTGAAVAVQLTPDRAAIDANGEDISIITVSVADDQGRIVPIVGNKISFELEGPGRILGVGNGDPSCHEPDTFVAVGAARKQSIDGWRMKKAVDVHAATVPEVAEAFDDSAWETADVTIERGPLGLREKAVYRARFNVNATDLLASAVELWFGKIEGGGSVYVNGEKVGPNGDARAASVFDVKKLLRPGQNVVAVTVANYSSAAGLNKGVELRFQDAPPPAAWSRSVFNGLAQIIVQGSKEPGELKLTAKADGLKSTTAVIQSKSSALRPAVPAY
ncbi:MAG: beta-galactosidase GalA [Nibricoccus sp.]